MQVLPIRSTHRIASHRFLMVFAHCFCVCLCVCLFAIVFRKIIHNYLLFCHIPTSFLHFLSLLSTKLNYFHRSTTAVENCDHYLNLTYLAAVPFAVIGSDANQTAIGYFGSALNFDDDRPFALIQVNDTC